MICTVRAFRNTGFDDINLPSSPAVLAGDDFEYRDYPDIALRQDTDLREFRIDAQWNDIKDTDYIMISDNDSSSISYYTVDLVTMVSTNTAILNVTLDPINTSNGIDSLQVISGTTKQWHVQNDEFAAYSEMEDYTPASPIQIWAIEIIFEKEGTIREFALSTVWLDDLAKIADDYTSGNGLTVTVPTLPTVSGTGNYQLVIGDTTKSKTIPNTRLYDVTSPLVQEGIRQVRSLGIEGAIVDTLAIGAEWTSYTPIPDNPGTAGIAGTTRYYTPGGGNDLAFNASYGTINNNKAFSGQFQKYQLLSICSGDSITFEMEDLFYREQPDFLSPRIIAFSDPSPGGRPYARPFTVKQSHYSDNPFMYAVQGAEWEKVPITYTTQSGQYQADVRQKFSTTRQVFNIISNAVQGVTGIVGGSLGEGGVTGGLNPGINALSNSINQTINAAQTAAAYEVDRYVVEPRVYFPNNPTLQGYYGNAFAIIKYGLTNSDLHAFDDQLNMYGYRQTLRLDSLHFHSRENFNYIRTQDANVRGTKGMRINKMINQILDRGVRLWHVKPSQALLTSANPIREV